MKKIKLKRFFIMIASAAAVAAINYTIFHTSFVYFALLVLFCHELGHYFAARINNIYSDLPYFIPFPVVSLGITHIPNMRNLSNSLKKKILAYGPITGFMVSMYFLFLSFIFPSIPTSTFLLLSISEFVFNYFGSDGKKYRSINEQENTLCIL